jgi:hypothetical protein
MHHPVPALAVTLLNAVTVMKMMQLQTKSAAQKEVLSFCDVFGHMAIKFIQNYQGLYGVITTYPQSTVVNIKDPVAFLTQILASIDMLRKVEGFPQESYLQNTVDDICNVICNALYKLRHLD